MLNKLTKVINFVDAVKRLRNELPNATIVAGNVVTGDMVAELIVAGADIINKEDPCTLPKACKNKVEIEGMKNCHIRDGIAVCRFLCWFDAKIYAGKLLDEGTLADKLDALRADMELFKGIS